MDEKEVRMPLYMYRVGYTSESSAYQVQRPANREESHQARFFRNLGGRIISFYYAFGEEYR